MNDFMACPECQGVMVLEDREEVLDSVDMMALFGYRCLACGHDEGATPSRLEGLEQTSLENRLMEKKHAVAEDISWCLPMVLVAVSRL